MRRLASLIALLAVLAVACSDPDVAVDLDAQAGVTVGTIPTATPEGVDAPTAEPGAAPEGPEGPTAEPPDTTTPTAQPSETPPEPVGSAAVPSPSTTADPTPEPPASPTPDPPTSPTEAALPDPSTRPPTPVPPTSPPAPPTPTPTPVPAGPADLRLQLTPLITLGPLTALASRPGSSSLFVAAKGGRVLELTVDGNTASVVREVLNVADRVSLGNEQGLLGVVFSPDGGHLYVNYTDGAGATNVKRFAYRNGTADLSTETTIVTVAQPAANHNGGDLAFGPDGNLYIAMGDGGGGGDQFGNGQNTATLLATILRFRPDGTIPGDNPFVGADGADEIWLYGVRNPWRISFDARTGDLWVADVGQGALEEVSVLYASNGSGRGANLGWPFVEGTAPYAQAGPPAGGNYVGPIFQYGRSSGCSVTGGYVYRGSAIPLLDGVYVFGDYCTSQIWGIVSSQSTGYQSFVDFGLNTGSNTLSAFGQGPDGELYALSLAGTLFRIDSAP